MRSSFVKIAQQIKQFLLEKIDLQLLLFLLLMMNYRFSFKIIAIAGIYFFRRDLKIKRNGIVYFYIAMLTLGLLNYLLIHRDYSFNHTMVVLTGCLIWLVCLLSYQQIRLAVERNEPEKIITTLKVIAVINCLISVFDIARVMYIKETFNPYMQISPPPYGISSGDFVGGVFGQVHLVNTVVSCLLIVFFLYQSCLGFALICLVPFLLTGSNLATIVLVGMFLYILFFKKNTWFKYGAVIGLLLIVVFYAKVTPGNQKYMARNLGNFFKAKDIGEKSIAPSGSAPVTAGVAESPVKKEFNEEELLYLFAIYKQRLNPKVQEAKKQEQSVYKRVYQYEHTASEKAQQYEGYVWSRKDSVQKAKEQEEFFNYGRLKRFDLEQEPGKITSFKQTFDYLSLGPSNLLFGAGIGSFSSRLAFISSGIVDDSRILMALPHYETPEFMENHKAIFKYLMFLDDETHSVRNLPFTWYNGVLGEYGLIGLLVFVICYLGFFVKRFRYLSYGKLLLPAMIAFFFFDYWYERLSVMLLFELILLLDFKINSPNKELS